MEITGEGLLGLRTLTGGEGTALVTVSGSIGSGANGQPSLNLMLDQTWYHTWTGLMTCPDTGSQSWDVPPATYSVEVTLPLEDGTRIENMEHIEEPFPCDTTSTFTLHVTNAE